MRSLPREAADFYLNIPDLASRPRTADREWPPPAFRTHGFLWRARRHFARWPHRLHGPALRLCRISQPGNSAIRVYTHTASYSRAGALRNRHGYIRWETVQWDYWGAMATSGVIGILIGDFALFSCLRRGWPKAYPSPLCLLCQDDRRMAAEQADNRHDPWHRLDDFTRPDFFCDLEPRFSENSWPPQPSCQPCSASLDAFERVSQGELAADGRAEFDCHALELACLT